MALEEVVHIPWYIMTSPLNDSKTMNFFLENGFFGLPEGSVKFFQQQTLPCLSSEGKLILEGIKSCFVGSRQRGGAALIMFPVLYF